MNLSTELVLGLTLFLACTVLFHCDAQEGYQVIALNEHNKFRKIHGSDNMTMDDKLNSLALTCAEDFVNKGTVDRKCGEEIGKAENTLTLTGIPPSSSPFPLEQMIMEYAIQFWYSREEGYNYSNPENSAEGINNHLTFTHLVWKSNTQLGCGIKIGEKMSVSICVYGSPDNNNPEEEREQIAEAVDNLDFKLFIQNVLPPLEST